MIKMKNFKESILYGFVSYLNLCYFQPAPVPHPLPPMGRGLCSGLSPVSVLRYHSWWCSVPYVVPGIEPWIATCKASDLTPVISLWPMSYGFKI